VLASLRQAVALDNKCRNNEAMLDPGSRLVVGEAAVKVRNPDDIVLTENAADAQILGDATICCPNCAWNQSDWDAYQAAQAKMIVSGTDATKSGNPLGS
jgi:hypothetical protein